MARRRRRRRRYPRAYVGLRGAGINWTPLHRPRLLRRRRLFRIF